MKTLTIHVRNDGLVFDLGISDMWCPRIGDRRWWRGWDKTAWTDWQSVATANAPHCLLKDVLEHGVTDIKIISDYAQQYMGFVPSKLACDLYDAIAKLLADPPEGTASYTVTLHDVHNVYGQPYHPPRPRSHFRNVTFGHRPGPAAKLQNLPRKAGKVPKLAIQNDIYSNAFKLFPKLPNFDANMADFYIPPVKTKTDYEKLEARVTALETSQRADWWAFRKPALIGTMYGGGGGGVNTNGSTGSVGGAGGPGVRTHYWVDESTAVPLPKTFAGVKFFESQPLWKYNTLELRPPKRDYSKMVLRIGEHSYSGLDLPSKITDLKRPAEFVYLIREVDDLAKKLRELKVRELTLRRHSGASMERLTEWLVAIVNASSPVMKIISDPEMMK